MKHFSGLGEAVGKRTPPRLMGVEVKPMIGETMKRFKSRRPRGALAVAAFVLSALTLCVLVILPLAVESRVPELRAGEVAVAAANH